jgi:protein-tyrosine phosphatase
MPSIILFLCTGNYYRSRFAEYLFNHLADAHRLGWRAESRGLAVELGRFLVGPISGDALRRLGELDVALAEPCRSPMACTTEDLFSAARVVALKEAEHRPLLASRHAGWESRVEYWHIHDLDFATPDVALADIERQVRQLVNSLKNDGASA